MAICGRVGIYEKGIKKSECILWDMDSGIIFVQKLGLCIWDLGCTLSETQRKTHLLYNLFKLRCVSFFFSFIKIMGIKKRKKESHQSFSDQVSAVNSARSHEK